jgi:hypothetical protein
MVNLPKFSIPLSTAFKLLSNVVDGGSLMKGQSSRQYFPPYSLIPWEVMP